MDAGPAHPAGGLDGGPKCASGQATCAGVCVNLEQDGKNCGSCGHACATGQVCSQSTCSSSCLGSTVCGEDGGSPYCTSVTTDRSNCGACGNACPSGQVCSAGACGESCAAGYAACGVDGGSPYCANEKTDVNNCGGCGIVCDQGASCLGGACKCGSAFDADCGGSGCPANDASCGGLCTSTADDPSNCGACGAVCGVDGGVGNDNLGKPYCSGGVCVGGCPSGQTSCTGASGPYCADTTDDADNCGGCGQVCPTGSTCTCPSGTCAGTSACSCPVSAPSICGMSCVNEDTDSENCGGCGDICTGGACFTSDGGPSQCLCPPAASTFCPTLRGSGSIDDGYCADISTDVANCGTSAATGCGNSCSVPAGDVAACCAGACENLSTDVSNCGGCAQVCSELNEPGCCDGGCVDLSSDNGNCGACGNACIGGSCVCASCGGPNCDTGASCSGTCACPSPDIDCKGDTQCQPASCGGSCINPQVDANNCGTCGHVCVDGTTCFKGGQSCCSKSQCFCHDFTEQGSVAVNEPCREACDCAPGSSCELSSTSGSLCCGSPMADAGPLGATCSQECDCQSGLCQGSPATCVAAISTSDLCSGCNSDADCSAGNYCVLDTSGSGNTWCAPGCTVGYCPSADPCTSAADWQSGTYVSVCYPPNGCG